MSLTYRWVRNREFVRAMKAAGAVERRALAAMWRRLRRENAPMARLLHRRVRAAADEACRSLMFGPRP